MSLHEPRCLVCGNPFGDKLSCMEDDVRKSEVCSDECYRIYMTDDDGVFHGREGREMSDYYGDGNKYRGVVSRDSVSRTIGRNELYSQIDRLNKELTEAYKTHEIAVKQIAELERLKAEYERLNAELEVSLMQQEGQAVELIALQAENAELRAERDDLVEAIEKALVEWPYPDAFTRILEAVISRGDALAGEGADVSTTKNVDGGSGGKKD